MLAKDLINYMIPPLKSTETVEKAMSWMNELHIQELPIVDQGRFKGIFSEKMLLDSAEEFLLVNEFNLFGKTVTVNENEHYYELLKCAYDAGQNLVPIVDQEEKYLGVVSIEDVVSAFSKMSSINSPGSIIALSIQRIDYSMAEVSRIIETESCKILSSFIEDHPEDSSKIILTIKLAEEHAKNAISALERFGFIVTSKYGDNSQEDNQEKERLDTLLKYLKI